MAFVESIMVPSMSNKKASKDASTDGSVSSIWTAPFEMAAMAEANWLQSLTEWKVEK